MELTVEVELSGNKSSLGRLDTIGVVFVTVAVGSLVLPTNVV